MGSFNVACVITGIPILEGDRAVMIPLLPSKYKDFDSISSTFYPEDFPVHGIYNDYGRLDVAQEQNMDFAMFMHEFAYKAALSSGKKFSEYWQAAHQKYGNGEKSHIETSEEAAFAPEVYDGIGEEAHRQMYRRTAMNDLLRGYMPMDGVSYWSKYILDADDPKAMYEKYKSTIDTIETIRQQLGFQFRPTYYAGQEMDLDLITGMAQLMMKYAEVKKAEYEY